ncbi:MAG: tryptophan--tRNA ligase [Candidatus Nealsonbacteria bacterium]|nr:MAG: tryptophan--tRNA ligase [Candidatus Nealsonbacteria bacterium]
MRILSGIQPTGSIHIGTYIGAVSQWKELQEMGECIFFIADLHALTIPRDPKTFSKDVMETAAELLASGIDPEKCILFVQSQVKEHTELTWILNTLTPVGELERMTQYKEKSRQFKKNINAGLFDYPVLQAADILLYQTDSVPVGKDQVQHLELTKTLARKFNKKYSKTFKVPEAITLNVGAKIMALNNPKKKMSKSSPQSCLYIFDEPEIIKKKVMTAVTDAGKTVKYDPAKKPGISNLITIYSLMSSKSIKEVEKKFKGKGYADFKKQLSALLIQKLEPFRKKKKELLQREVYVKEILERGRKRAQALAESTMVEVRKKVGLI